MKLSVADEMHKSFLNRQWQISSYYGVFDGFKLQGRIARFFDHIYANTKSI